MSFLIPIFFDMLPSFIQVYLTSIVDFRENYAHPELHMERNLFPRVHTSISGPTDWNEALDIIAHGAPEQVQF